MRLIVGRSGVTSFVFAFDAFVCDVDVMKEWFVVIFGKSRSGELGRGPETLAQGSEVPVAQEVRRLLVWQARMVRGFWRTRRITVRIF